MIRIVLDTNVLVSALLAPRGNEADITRTAIYGDLQPIISNETFAEYKGVLLRAKFDLVRKDATAILQSLQSKATLVQPSKSEFVSPDPTDTVFLECAVAAQADFLVTGNKRHFPAPFYGRTEIVNARTLLERLAAIL